MRFPVRHTHASRPHQRVRTRSGLRLLLEPLETRCLLAVFTVTTTADEGPGSLRQAILDANDRAGLDRIEFAIDADAQTIAPKSTLPSVRDSVVIDGTTQPGYQGSPLIELDGSGAGRVTGLHLTGPGGSAVRGLVINRFGTGISVASTNNVVTGNYLGTDRTGSISLANEVGLGISGSENRVGGTTPEDRNLISGNNRAGISITGSRNVVQGNFLGTDVTGTKPLGNNEGVIIGHSTGGGGRSNRIGGLAPGAGNLISGNTLYGIRITGSASGPANDNVVQGNLIGTDVTGTQPLGNGQYGVYLAAALRSVIGGPEPGAGNLITFNGRAGVWLSAAGAWVVADTRVQGNLIVGNDGDGVYVGHLAMRSRLEGNVVAGNAGAGVRIRGNADSRSAVDSRVGGTEDGQANAIFANGGPGIVVDRGVRNAVRGNSIADNAGLGIELLNGGNDDQEAPELSAAVAVGNTLFVDGALSSRPEGAFHLDFYASATCDKSGFGEGEYYLGTREVETDGDGLAVFAEEFAAEVPAGWFLTATATDAFGNTSAFSGCVDVREPGGAPGSGPGMGWFATAGLNAPIATGVLFPPLTRADLTSGDAAPPASLSDAAAARGVANGSTLLSDPSQSSAALLDALFAEIGTTLPLEDGILVVTGLPV